MGDNIINSGNNTDENIYKAESGSIPAENTSEVKNHIEFSKILTASIVFMYIINWAVTWLVYAETGNISAELKGYLDIPLNIVMAGYLTKSGVENIFAKKDQGV